MLLGIQYPISGPNPRRAEFESLLEGSLCYKVSNWQLKSKTIRTQAVCEKSELITSAAEVACGVRVQRRVVDACAACQSRSLPAEFLVYFEGGGRVIP